QLYPQQADMLFAPDGANLAAHNLNIAQILPHVFLTPLLGTAGAFNVTVVMILFLNMICAYLLIDYVFGDQRVAIFGGVVFGLNQWTLFKVIQPEMMSLFSIPLVILLVIRMLREDEIRSAVLAGLLVGLSAYITLYVVVMLFVILAILVPALLLEEKRWRSARAWLSTTLFAALAGVAVSSRVLPMISIGITGDVLAKSVRPGSSQVDMLGIVWPFLSFFWRPLVTDSFVGFHYMGLVVVSLFVFGVISQRKQWLVTVMAALSIVFVAISFGSSVSLGGQSVPLPSAFSLSQTLVPFIFGALVRPWDAFIGLLLPMTLVASAGLVALVDKAEPRISGTLVVALCIGFYLVDTWMGPMPMWHVEQPAYIAVLNEAEPGAVIDLPMGRPPSKIYMYYQTRHERPIVEGIVAREVPELYAYIRGNPLLRTWRQGNPIDCEALSPEVFEQLQDDNFTWIVVHYDLIPDGMVPLVESYFATSTPYYADDQVSIYRLSDYDPCGYNAAER
ncbi:MAG: hypothetical protein ACFB51_08445, partial [Anaerolineae bacterium]